MIRFIQTSGACPEQYSAFIGDTEVAYLRLRDGRFRVNCPDSDGLEMYAAHPNGDGLFDDDEREFYLGMAAQAIIIWKDQVRLDPKDIPFEVMQDQGVTEID